MVKIEFSAIVRRAVLLLIAATLVAGQKDEDEPSPYTAIRLEKMLFGTPDRPKSWCSLPICEQTMVLTNGSVLYPWEIRALNLPQMVRRSALEVDVGLYIDSVLAVDERELSMVVRARVHLAWYDCRLKWNVSEFDGIAKIEIPPYAQIFKPQLLIQESYDEMVNFGESANMVISSDGVVVAEIPQIELKTLCQFLLHLYPFDTQTCNISLIVPYYDLRYVNLSLWDEAFPEQVWSDRNIDSNMWLYKNWTHSHGEVDGLNSRLTMTLTIERLPLFHLFNLVLPCSLLIFLCCTIFALPRGENDDTKINVSVTILLSVVVFMLILYDRLPETGAYVALLSQYFAGCIILCSTSCLFAVIFALIDSFSQVEDVLNVPWFLHKLFFHHIGPLLLCYRFRFLHYQWTESLDETQSSSIERSNGKVSMNGNATDLNERIELMQHSDIPIRHKQDKELRCKRCPFFSLDDVSEWQVLAEVCYRLFFVVFLVVTICFEVAFFSMG